ncbi:hypothetical protein RFI_00395 [Reticulomyxa filosa]|uniref:Uncharacterized protein n=1 Tax=Reticulomyxa filosa TaxID=46433 RepID=X6PG47_RETFI|nr:hypothetical protein RFI_00395 [Reticulomyxa filosa]|eukprot:ETO36667.1 hypothetical protein RFI_00395 [Reticulomyxa filosa]
MGNNLSNNTSKDEPTNSFIEYKKSFDEHNKNAFLQAHTESGRKKEYITDRNDGRDFKAEIERKIVQAETETGRMVKSSKSEQTIEFQSSHTLIWTEKIYITNRDDGRDLKAERERKMGKLEKK